MAMAAAADREQEIAGLIAECVRRHRANLRDDVSGLYWHGLPSRREGHDGFIGHGTGWTAMGLVHLLDCFPTAHDGYADILSMFREVCEAAIRFQDEDGTFHSFLNVPWTPYCTHYTCWMGHVFLRGARKGYLDRDFVRPGLKAWEATKARAFQGDVIAIGEMRDYETIKICLTAAETGVLVLSTLHIISIDKIIERLLSYAPDGSDGHMRALMAETLQGVIHQELLPTVNGGKRVACELLIGTDTIRNVMRKRETFHLRNLIVTGQRHGMQTMKASLDQLYENGDITDSVYDSVIENYR